MNCDKMHCLLFLLLFLLSPSRPRFVHLHTHTQTHAHTHTHSKHSYFCKAVGSLCCCRKYMWNKELWLQLLQHTESQDLHKTQWDKELQTLVVCCLQTKEKNGSCFVWWRERTESPSPFYHETLSTLVTMCCMLTGQTARPQLAYDNCDCCYVL